MQEKGEIRNIGTTDEPRFVNARGESLDERCLARSRGAPPASPDGDARKPTPHKPDSGP
jgi:hypothetical protein